MTKNHHRQQQVRELQKVDQPFHQLGSSEVGCHGLVVLTLHCKRMAVSYPCRTVSPLQCGGFAAGHKNKNVQLQLNNMNKQEVCRFLYIPQVSSSMFIFMANHKIVAPNSKPGHLMRSFYLAITQ